MMPTYDFEDEKGAPVQLWLEMGEAPDYGEWIDVAGRRLVRVFERAHDLVPPAVPRYECIVRSQPKWDPTYPRYDKNGHGVILSKKEHADYKAQNPHLVWD